MIVDPIVSNILPSLEWNDNSFTHTQDLFIAFSIYTVAGIFCLLLLFCLHNIYMYLYRQSKWRVFPLSMYYTMAVVMIVFRIYETIMTVKTTAEWIVLGVLFPAALKFYIGIVEIEVIIELIIRVREAITNLKAEQNNSYLHEPRMMMQYIQTSQARADLTVKILRGFTLAVCCVGFFGMGAYYIHAEHQKDKAERALMINDQALFLSWWFLAISVLITITILALMREINRGGKESINFPNSFNKELNKLYMVLGFFMVTYFLHWISDYWVIPALNNEETLIDRCVVKAL